MASLAGVGTTRKEYQRANRVLTCGGSRLVTSMETYVDGGRFVRPQLGDEQALLFLEERWRQVFLTTFGVQSCSS